MVETILTTLNTLLSMPFKSNSNTFDRFRFFHASISHIYRCYSFFLKQASCCQQYCVVLHLCLLKRALPHCWLNT